MADAKITAINTDETRYRTRFSISTMLRFDISKRNRKKNTSDATNFIECIFIYYHHYF